MSQRDTIETGLPCKIGEKRLPRPAGVRFEVAGNRSQINSSRQKRHGQTLREISDKSLVAVGVSAAQAMIQVPDRDGIAEFAKHKKEAHRVCSARNSGQHAVVRREHVMLLNGAMYK